MKVVGEATAGGSVETVWRALHDAAVLARAIPGCEHFEVCGPGLGQFVATTALPAISGTYTGKLTIVEQQRPRLLRLTVSVTADRGTISADATVRLSAAGGVGPGATTPPDPPGGASPGETTPLEPPGGTTTLVSYEADGAVTGPVAAAGTRLLTSAAKRLASEFFAAIDESVTSHAAARSTAPAPASAAAESPAAKPAAAAAPAGGSGGSPPRASTAGGSGGSPPRASTAGGSGGSPPRSSTAARPGPLADNRVALVAGAAIGLAGVIVGVLAGRRSGRASRVRG